MPGESFQSRADGVVHIAATCPDSFGSPRELILPFTRFTASSATGVCQSECAAAAFRPGIGPRFASGGRGPPVPSDLTGVGQSAVLSATFPRYSGTVFCPALRFLNAAHFAIVSSLRTRLTDVGVGHIPAAASKQAICPKVRPNPFPLPCRSLHSCLRSIKRTGSFASKPDALAVGHKPQAISSMGRIDGTSRNNDRPAGVADAFQVRRHSVEPILANRCRNLFSHDDRGPTGSNETEEDGPEVALVRLALLFACGAEGLAGGASGPQGPVVGPSGEAGGVGPAADASEEMALDEAPEVIRGNIEN